MVFNCCQFLLYHFYLVFKTSKCVHTHQRLTLIWISFYHVIPPTGENHPIQLGLTLQNCPIQYHIWEIEFQSLFNSYLSDDVSYMPKFQVGYIFILNFWKFPDSVFLSSTRDKGVSSLGHHYNTDYNVNTCMM